MSITQFALAICRHCEVNFANVDDDGLCDPCAQAIYNDDNTPRCSSCQLPLEENEDGICSVCKEDELLVEHLAAELDRQWQMPPRVMKRLVKKMMQ